MAENAGMQVGEGALQQAANTISESQNSLQSRLQRLEGDLSNVSAIWQGPAAARFTQLMAQWRENADKTTKALSEFVDNLALRWVSLNVVHSFREGNTRSQLVFFSELAHHAGYHLDARAFLPPSREDRLAGVTNPVRERFVAARYYFQDYHDHTPMADTLAEVIAPLTEDQRRARSIIPIEER